MRGSSPEAMPPGEAPRAAGSHPALTPRQRTVQRGLWAGCAAFWALCAVRPHDREVWALENALVILVLVLAWLLRHRFTLSHRALSAFCAFLVLHTVGAHFTYSQVPYARWLPSWSALAAGRNDYDRFVHFSAGLLVTGALRELLPQVFRMSEAAARAFALTLAMALSLVYELIEWGAAAAFGGGVGAAYLGTQGDVWDAQKDMALASLGALIATLVSSLEARRHERAPRA